MLKITALTLFYVLVTLQELVSAFTSSSSRASFAVAPGLLRTSSVVLIPPSFAPLRVKGNGELSGEDQQLSPETEFSQRFAQGKDLQRLRADLRTLRENMQWAKAMNDEMRVNDLAQAIQKGEERDPDAVYGKALREISRIQVASDVSAEEKNQRLKQLRRDAQLARACLPRFQMEGLWMGNYGEKGVQLVNITYVGDTLVATKATGDINVPRGEVTFTANLAPRNDTVIEPQPQKASFDPQSSTQHLPRYPGKGQIAKAGFVNSKYVEGQMVLFDNLFSFIWVPSRHHVLFRRPTSEQTIALLRNVISEEDTLENMRDHLERCFDMDMTESLARFHAQQGQEPFRRISKAEDLQAPNAGNGLLPVSFEGDTSKSFWQVPNWNQLMDSVLGEDGKNGKNNHGEAAW